MPVNFSNGNAFYQHFNVVEDTIRELIILNIPENFKGMYVFALCGVVENGSLTLRVWLRTRSRRLNYDLTETARLRLLINDKKELNLAGNRTNRIMRDINVDFVEGKAVFEW